ncbi:hypothetical protein [Oryzihumus sp.]
MGLHLADGLGRAGLEDAVLLPRVQPPPQRVTAQALAVPRQGQLALGLAPALDDLGAERVRVAGQGERLGQAHLVAGLQPHPHPVVQ